MKSSHQLSIAVALALGLAACGKKEEAPKPAAAKKKSGQPAKKVAPAAAAPAAKAPAASGDAAFRAACVQLVIEAGTARAQAILDVVVARIRASVGLKRVEMMATQD